MRFEIIFSVFALVVEAAVIKHNPDLKFDNNKEVIDADAINNFKTKKIEEVKVTETSEATLTTSKGVSKEDEKSNVNIKNVKNKDTINANTENVSIFDTNEAPTNSNTRTEDVPKIDSELESMAEIFEDPSIFPIVDCFEDCTEEELNEFLLREDLQSKYKDDYFDEASELFFDVSRFKRSANIIEEENRATTVPKHHSSGSDTKTIYSRLYNNVHT